MFVFINVRKMLKVFDKNHVNVAKKLKRQRTISNGWFIIKLTFLQPPFATALYSFEHVTHIKKISDICKIGKHLSTKMHFRQTLLKVESVIV